MTTILADARFGVMVSDSSVVDGDRVWSARKVQRIRGALVGGAGDLSEINWFIDWFKGGAIEAPTFNFTESTVLVLDGSGLYLYETSSIALTRVPKGRESIGSGGVAAIAAYEALGFTDPKRAVAIACKHDAHSRAPVRVYTL